MSNLNQINNEIKSAQFDRVELKKRVLEIEELRNSEQKQIETIEDMVSIGIYLNDTEKKFTNDTARKMAVKQNLLGNNDYQKAVSELERFTRELNLLEIYLRENQIKIDFLLREFEINSKFATV